MTLPSGAQDTPGGQPHSAPGNTTPPATQPDPAGATGATAAPPAPPSHVAPPPPPAAPPAQDKGREQTLEERKAHRGVLLEGLAQAHDNHVKEIDAMGSAIAQGQAPTVEMMLALRASAIGLRDVIDRLGKEHGITGEVRVAETRDTPGTAGRALR